MTPTIPDGSLVTVDVHPTVVNNLNALLGKPVAIYRHEDETCTIKRLAKTKARQWIAMPDNLVPVRRREWEYRPFLLEEGDRIVGLVTTVHAQL